jgi:superfamily II DNA/RNA helicase
LLPRKGNQLISLTPDLDRAVKQLGWTTFTPVQELAIPALRSGRDLFAQAQTGTGKTGAFALPILERVEGRAGAPFTLVVVPTRELGQQVAREIEVLGRFRHARVVALYGGVGYRAQEDALRPRCARRRWNARTSPRSCLATHARPFAHQILVLDEADRLLDLGFAPGHRAHRRAPQGARGRPALFSATLTNDVRAVARKYTKDPVSVTIKPEEPIVAAIDQAWVQVRESDKVAALHEILRREDVVRTLVFRRTKHGADKLVKALGLLGSPARALHGNVGQHERERVLEGFRTGRIPTLVATNLAARGIHVDDIGHVVNFDLPEDAETFVHRTGRTGRAGRRGVAFTFVK